MTIALRLLPALAIAAIGLLPAGCQKAPASADAQPNAEEQNPVRANAPLPQVLLVITRTDGSAVTFVAEVALDKLAQEKGLSARTSMAPDAAMIFPFERLTPASFWMKGISLPLDHLFVRADGTIAAILPGKPGDLTPISTGESVRAVIQIGGGRAKTLGLVEGSKVRWGACRGMNQRPPEAWDRLAFCP